MRDIVTDEQRRGRGNRTAGFIRHWLDAPLDTLLAQIICEQNTSKTISFKNSMARYRQFIFPFLYDPLITYDNNASERSIRNIKVKLKVSGQFKTGQEHYCILRSIIDTTIKNGQSVFDAISAIAHLPSPPIPPSRGYA